MPRMRIEYGGCSHTKRSRLRRSDDPLRLDDVLGRERRVAEVADLALVHEVAQRAERLVDVGVLVGPVDLVEVDVVGAQPPQAVLALLEDPAAGPAVHVRVLAHRPHELGREHDAVAPVRDRLADDLLGLAGGVDVGGVDEVDAGFERAVRSCGRSRRGRGCPTGRTSWRRGSTR